MRHPSYDAACDVCHANAGEAPSPGGVIFANDLWFVRHYAASRAAGGLDDAPSPAARAGTGAFHG